MRALCWHGADGVAAEPEVASERDESTDGKSQ